MRLSSRQADLATHRMGAEAHFCRILCERPSSIVQKKQQRSPPVRNDDVKSTIRVLNTAPHTGWQARDLHALAIMAHHIANVHTLPGTDACDACHCRDVGEVAAPIIQIQDIGANIHNLSSECSRFVRGGGPTNPMKRT